MCEFRDGAPIRVVLGFKLAAARVKGVAAAFGRERMQQKFAVTRIAGGDELRDTFEVEPGLLFSPGCLPGRQFLQMEGRLILRMTGVTSGVFTSLLKKNRLDAASINLKIKGRLFRGSLLHAGDSGRFRSRVQGTHTKRSHRYQNSQMTLFHQRSPPLPASKAAGI